MAYTKQSIRVVAGGLNLTAPADLIDDSEAQELLNFSTDSTGSLRSRRGHQLAFSVGARIVALLKTLGARWAAAGGAVYKEGAAIISGVSADRVGLVGWKDFIWVMSEADQRKSDGTNDWRWIPVAPTTKATIVAAAPVETTVVDFTQTFQVDPAGFETYDPELTIHSASDNQGVWSAYRDIALDLFTGHSIDDVFKITLKSNRWKNVEEVIFQVDVNNGDFQTDYYQARMNLRNIRIARKEEVTFYLRKRPLAVDDAAKDKFNYGSFERIGSAANKDWRSGVRVRVKVDFSGDARVRFLSWKCVGDRDNTLEGDDFTVYRTYTTAAGHESNPAPVSEPITVNHVGIDVSGMTASGDPQVTGQNIYLTGGTLGRVYRVNGATPIAATTYQIRKRFDDLTNDGLILEVDHDDPPTVGGLVGPYFGRLIAFGDSKIYWSHTNKPYAFAGPTLLDGDWVAVEEGVGQLVAATQYPGMAYFYGTEGVVVAQGDFGDLASAIHSLTKQGGVQSANGVVQTARGDFVNFPKGVYAFNGGSAELLSKKIERVFKDNGFAPTKAALGYFNDVLWVSDGAQTYRLDLPTGRWFKDSRVFSCFLSDGDRLLGGTPTGDVLELESGTSDAGAAFPVAWKSKAFDGGILDNEKTWEDATIWASTGGATLTVTAYLNDGQSDQFTIALGTISSSRKTRFVLRFNPNIDAIPVGDPAACRARNCALGITGAVSSESVIHEIALNYYVEARAAKTFDSDEKDFGTNKIKICREVYVDLDSRQPARLVIQTDQPGFEMAARDNSHSFAASLSRRGEPYVLPADALGHNLRFLLSGEDFRLYSMRALMQIVGTYLHGSKGQYWDSDPLDFGIEQVKLLKEVEVVYSGSGGVFNIKTDLPGNALASRGNAAFPTIMTEQSIKVRVQDNIKGRLLQFRYTPEGDTRIEAIRLFMKVVGRPNASPWSWFSLNVPQTSDGIWQDVLLEPDAVG